MPLDPSHDGAQNQSRRCSLLCVVIKLICKHWAASLSCTAQQIQEVDEHKNTKQFSHKLIHYRQLFVTHARLQAQKLGPWTGLKMSTFWWQEGNELEETCANSYSACVSSRDCSSVLVQNVILQDHCSGSSRRFSISTSLAAIVTT